MNVPLLDLRPQHESLQDEIIGAIQRVLSTQEFILGREVAILEENVTRYSGVKHGIGVSSGTDGLLVALMALGIGPGDEVITSPYSFFATAGVISRLGATPVFVDVEPETFNIDPSQIEAKITRRSKAILPVHLFGQVAEMDPILEIASRYGLSVVEDSAQAIGAQYKDGRRAGSMGDIGCLSFFPTKNLGALGDAGMVLTSDDALAEKLRILRVHGGKPKYYHQIIGGNFRLDAIQAAVLNVKLIHLDRWTADRQRNADRYVRLFAELGVKQVELSKPIYKASGVRHYHIYNQFVIRTSKRDALREHLKRSGITTEVYYPVPFHLQKCFESLGYSKGAFPDAEKLANESLALPIYPELTEQQQRYVVEEIREFEGQ